MTAGAVPPSMQQSQVPAPFFKWPAGTTDTGRRFFGPNGEPLYLGKDAKGNQSLFDQKGNPYKPS
jgi:hypothetical protein